MSETYSVMVTDLLFLYEFKNLVIFRFIFLFQKIAVVFSVYVCYPAVNCQFSSFVDFTNFQAFVLKVISCMHPAPYS